MPKLREHPDHDIMGARMKVAQELLRNADIQTTMNVYTEPWKRTKEKPPIELHMPYLPRCNDGGLLLSNPNEPKSVQVKFRYLMMSGLRHR